MSGGLNLALETKAVREISSHTRYYLAELFRHGLVVLYSVSSLCRLFTTSRK